jgi:hypothetical protein
LSISKNKGEEPKSKTNLKKQSSKTEVKIPKSIDHSKKKDKNPKSKYKIQRAEVKDSKSNYQGQKQNSKTMVKNQNQ